MHLLWFARAVLWHVAEVEALRVSVSNHGLRLKRVSLRFVLTPTVKVRAMSIPWPPLPKGPPPPLRTSPQEKLRQLLVEKSEAAPNSKTYVRATRDVHRLDGTIGRLTHQSRYEEGRGDRSNDWRRPFMTPASFERAYTEEKEQISPGSPWASGSRKAWVLDEQTMWRRQDSVVHEVRRWCEKKGTLSAQAASNLGFDPFLYHVRGYVTPSPERFETLKHRLDELSVGQPDDLHRAVHYEQLGELLGEEFSWVQLPKTKTNGDSPKEERKPW